MIFYQSGKGRKQTFIINKGGAWGWGRLQNIKGAQSGGSPHKDTCTVGALLLMGKGLKSLVPIYSCP